MTTTLPLVGAPAASPLLYADQQVPPRLRRRFGTEAAAVDRHGPREIVAPGAAAMQCEVGWAVAAEGAVTADDVDRRLRLDLVPEWRDAARGYVDEVLSAER